MPIVLIAEEQKGQIFLSIHHDIHPQLCINNKCGTKILCAQYSLEDKEICEESKHFKWICSIDNESSTYYTMPIISKKFPDLQQSYRDFSLVIASDFEDDPQNVQWSSPICLENFNDQFIKVPYYGDVKVLVFNTSRTIYVSIESLNKIEISAKDVRVRLMMHEKEASENKKNVTFDKSLVLKNKSPTVSNIKLFYSVL